MSHDDDPWFRKCKYDKCKHYTYDVGYDGGENKIAEPACKVYNWIDEKLGIDCDDYEEK